MNHSKEVLARYGAVEDIWPQSKIAVLERKVAIYQARGQNAADDFPVATEQY